jgi:hypothetical protein
MTSIDTIALRCESPLPQPHELGDYRDRGWTLNVWAGREQLSYMHKDLPRMFWSQSYGKGWLTVETSLPSLLRGDNTRLLDEFELNNALARLSDFVADISGRDFDCGTALVGRVDYAHDFLVSEKDIPAYIAAAASLSLARFIRESTGTTTVSFRSKSKQKSRQIILYGKLLETLKIPSSTAQQRNEARDKLRKEQRYFGYGVRSLAAHYSISRQAKDLLRTDIASTEIQRAMNLLHLDKPISARIDARNEALIKAYGFKKAEPLIGFLQYLDRFGEDFYLLPESGYGQKTYSRRAHDCRKAGVWRRSERPANLPALSLVQNRAEIHRVSNRDDFEDRFVRQELQAVNN